MGTIDNQIAIVTGGGGGIGGAVADRFAREGAKLAVVDIDADAAKAQAARLAKKGADAIAIAADVTNEQSVRTMVQAALDRWGRIDICHCRRRSGSQSPT
jgi:NAD(P)-dependent dehydrogenase (short-subunit alcohol dehydrogenase family)